MLLWLAHAADDRWHGISPFPQPPLPSVGPPPADMVSVDYDLCTFVVLGGFPVFHSLFRGYIHV